MFDEFGHDEEVGGVAFHVDDADFVFGAFDVVGWHFRLSNVHIYQNHIMQCHEMLRRDVTGRVSPRLHVDMQPGWADARTLIDEITPDHLQLGGYEPLGKLPAEMLAPIRKE